MKLAVTKGADFLGYHLCNQVQDKYEEIFLLDIAPINPEEYPENARYFKVEARN